ncbi:uncharacterized protein N7459_006617 [Penicillium hispanicum]|uniref:uncharacterized protein n=1 Tax=Penicillium hispanicum TaxID=1080232 RepID=UPI002541FC56|nr:uncharacterized protein N7459_006617 [Penicillium hispanicum]KAJ5577653.1 hypothetical protein N7459_006617 [Penicillium hispanicum]
MHVSSVHAYIPTISQRQVSFPQHLGSSSTRLPNPSRHPPICTANPLARTIQRFQEVALAERTKQSTEPTPEPPQGHPTRRPLANQRTEKRAEEIGTRYRINSLDSTTPDTSVVQHDQQIWFWR